MEVCSFSDLSQMDSGMELRTIDCTRLKGTPKYRDHGTKHDSPTTAKHVCEDHVQNGACHCATLKGRNYPSCDGSGGITEVIRKGLKCNGRSDNTRIVTEEQTSGCEEEGREDGERATHLGGFEKVSW